MNLSPAERALIAEARRASLATIGEDGRSRLVPICFAVVAEVVWTPLDAKPKAVDDVRRLARVRDIARDPRVTLLVDRWSEDWSELAWLRLEGSATLVEPPLPDVVVEALVARYPHYATHDLAARPAIRIDLERATSWSSISGRD
jgi:PPOX class probable F420-dependent enzyme